MKALVIVYDGMADRPIPTLGNKTPMEVAHKPAMDALAPLSLVGTVSNVPSHMVPESDTANLAILSYDPSVYSKGRSPLEAMSMGLTMTETQTAIRCNLVTLSDEGDYDDKIIIDHSSGEIETEDAHQLILALEEALGTPDRHFYTGISYRHCILWEDANDHYPFHRPHDILGQRIKDHLPQGKDGQVFYDLMRASYEVLNNHPVNVARRKAGKRVANSIWLWSPGKKPALPSFYDKWGIRGAVISAVDLIKGIAICAGMTSIDVAGATGNLHTNYRGKADAAIDAFRDGMDLVYIHIEAPDECGHQGDIEGKILSIEKIDAEILSPVLAYLTSTGEPFRVLTLPDHPTPIELRTHSIEPVPFMLYDSAKAHTGVNTLNEQTASQTGLYLPQGTALMDLLLH